MHFALYTMVQTKRNKTKQNALHFDLYAKSNEQIAALQHIDP